TSAELVAVDETAGDMEAELRRELYRSRRYERALALVAGPDDDHGSIATSVAASIRAIDRVWTGDRRFVLMLPEVGRSDAEALVDRLQEKALSSVERDEVTILAFPEDGLTAGALLGGVH